MAALESASGQARPPNGVEIRHETAPLELVWPLVAWIPAGCATRTRRAPTLSIHLNIGWSPPCSSSNAKGYGAERRRPADCGEITLLPESMREQAFRHIQQVACRKLLARSTTPSPSTAVTARMPLAQRVLLRMSFISRNVMGATNFGCGQIRLLVSRRMIGLATATLLTLVNQVSGTPYVSGGDSPRGTDCSGLASWVANAATGRPIYGDRFNTRNQESALLARGFRYGTEPGALVIGWNGGHTAVTLPDGTPVSSGEGGGVKVGGGGAYQPQFNQHMYLPAVEPDAADAPPADAPAADAPAADAPAADAPPADAPPPIDPFAPPPPSIDPFAAPPPPPLEPNAAPPPADVVNVGFVAPAPEAAPGAPDQGMALPPAPPEEIPAPAPDLVTAPAPDGVTDAI
jgi:hypothetical protein